ncbi:VIP2 family actin-ADP-ribosylating toxin [Apilactobacillus sp. M161]|uniref:VIP2 family actin-ADP-ribosylating toxin n=2 Tax=Apilactobacillus xinyiensis TaxID=2841032 RepID=A0ABT0I1D8_9LACO|nr:ADP-ribosyltransferase [Apilactobacillus xinyiensis]MCK8624537.1 VIP2 family actin-ADP-ribosylating toxin [Apilactobacillus xinyiensis]
MKNKKLSFGLLITGLLGVGIFSSSLDAQANINLDSTHKNTIKFMEKLSKTNGNLAMIMQDTQTTSQSNNEFVTNKNMQGNSLENNEQVTIPTNTPVKYLGNYKDGSLITTNANKVMYVKNFNDSVYNTKTYSFSKATENKLKNLTKKWHKSLSKDEVKAVGSYTYDGYQDINGYLRNPSAKTSNKVKKETKDVTKAISKFSTPYNLTVYRGISDKGLQASLNNQPLKVGAKYFDKAFSSTSLSRSIGESFGNILLKINVPLGNRGAYIAPISHHKNEKEFLLNPGTKMIVTSIENKKVTLSGQLTKAKNAKSKKNASFKETKKLKVVTLSLMNE